MEDGLKLENFGELDLFTRFRAPNRAVMSLSRAYTV